MPPRLALRRAVAVLAVAVTAACRPGPATTAPPGPDVPVVWYSGDALAARAISSDPRDAPPALRLARLDLLLDLLDAARFADDPAAREQLWLGLGGTASARGEAATRDASTRLLGEAIKLDSGPLADDARSFVAGVITLLSADLGLIGAADDLAIRTAAYRDVAADGHPRAADNARWRLYDHVRGCLQGAVTAPQERRPEVAVHALYVREDSLAAWLDDRAVHAQSPPPSADELLALMLGPRDALAADPRWITTVKRRLTGDSQLASARARVAARPARPDLAARRGPPGHRPPRQPPPDRPHRRPPRQRRPRLPAALARPSAAPPSWSAPSRPRWPATAAARCFWSPRRCCPRPPSTRSPRTLLDARVARIELAVREPRVSSATPATPAT